MKPYLLATLIIAGLALGARAADESPFLWNDATSSEARLFFGGARDAGWDCNVICSQPIQPKSLVTLQP